MKRRYIVFLILLVILSSEVMAQVSTAGNEQACVSVKGLELLVDDTVRNANGDLVEKIDKQTESVVNKMQGYGYWALGEYETMTNKLIKRVLYVLMAGIIFTIVFIVSLSFYFQTRALKNLLLIMKDDMSEIKKNNEVLTKNFELLSSLIQQRPEPQPTQQPVVQEKPKEELVVIPDPEEPEPPKPKKCWWKK